MAMPYLLNIILEKYKSKNFKQSFVDWLDHTGKTALYKAVMKNDIQAVKLLINYGADVNFCDGVLLKCGEQIDPLPTPNQISVLSAAVITKSIECVNLLLQHGANANSKDTTGRTPLHHATAAKAASQLVSVLIKNGADPAAIDSQGRTPLHFACEAHMGGADDDIESLEALLCAGADPYARDFAGCLPMHYVFTETNHKEETSFSDPIALVTALHRFMAQNLRHYSKPDNNGQTVLHRAAKRGANICCIAMISFCSRSQPCLNIDQEDNCGNTAFGLAVLHRHYACALTLIQNGCRWTQPVVVKRRDCISKECYDKINEWRWKPIRSSYSHSTTSSCATQVIRHNWPGMLYLMTQKLNGNVTHELKYLIDAALSEQKYNLAQTLIRQIDFKLETSSQLLCAHFLRVLAETNPKNELPLSVSPVVAVAEMLCECFDVRLDAEDISYDVISPVVLTAARHHNWTMIDYLESKLKCKFSAFEPSADGHTILTSFFHTNYSWTGSRLKWLGDFIKKHQFSLNVLAEYSLPVDLTDCARISNDTVTERDKLTPLIRAIHFKRFDLVKFMLNSGSADVNLADSDGRTPLMHAIMINSVHFVKLIMDFNYDIKTNSENCGSFDENEIDSYVEISALPSSGPMFNLGIKRRLGGATESSKRNKRQCLASSTADVGKKFKCTSSVNLAACDSKNWDAFDYLVSPLPTVGAWQNAEILNLFLINGAHPFDFHRVSHFACKSGQRTLLNEWRRYLDKNISADLEVQDQPFWTDDDQRKAENIYGSNNQDVVDVVANAAEFWRHLKSQCASKLNLEKTKKIEEILPLEGLSLTPESLSQVQCHLPNYLKDLIEDLADFDSLKRTASDLFYAVRRSYPLIVSSLRKERIIEAINVINRISVCIKELAQPRSDLGFASSSDRNARVKRCITLTEQQYSLSCEFYRLLPLKDFEDCDVVAIDEHAVLRYTGMIDSLLNFERLTQVLCGAYIRATSGDVHMHPLDYIYKSLGCAIVATSANDPIIQHILHYKHNTSPRGYRVVSVHNVFNSSLDSEFHRNLNSRLANNRRLLWHGTKASNLVGILTHGLAPAPFYADCTGQLFGKGIYTADTFSKSIQYCEPSKSGMMYMLLCEVALGKSFRCVTIKTDQHDTVDLDVYDSVHGVGRMQPDPQYDLTLPTGEFF